MDLWMKVVWALAAVACVACLVMLGQSAGSGGGVAPAAASGGAVSAPLGPDYFIKRDAARSTVEYGVREGGRTIIYNNSGTIMR